jgi:hypothetical protein
MLEKLHKRFDERIPKCCFSSTMKMRWLIPVTGLLVWMMNSCATSGGGAASGGRDFVNPVNPKAESDASNIITGGLRSGDSAINRNSIDAILNNPNRTSGSGVKADEAFAPPRKERPGLATTFGETRKSPMTSTSFERASTKPYGVDAIYYNDREGLKAMGALDSKVSGLQTTAGGVMEWGVKGGFGFLPTYVSYTYNSRTSSGSYRRFIEGSHNGRYTIVLKNVCKSPLQVVLSVDGLDVIDGKPASVSKRGYVVPAGETLEVQGYRTGYDSVAAFKFSTVSNSYANLSRGDTRNVGVIGLAVYTQKNTDPWTWMPGEIRTRETASPFAAAP